MGPMWRNRSAQFIAVCSRSKTSQDQTTAWAQEVSMTRSQVDRLREHSQDRSIDYIHKRQRDRAVTWVYTGCQLCSPLCPCSAPGSDHLCLCVYRHLLMPPVREAWRPQRLFHGHCTPCPLPLAPFSSVPRNATTNWPAKGSEIALAPSPQNWT